MSNRYPNMIIYCFLMLALILAGCTGGLEATQEPVSPENKDLEYTQAAQTIVVELTQNAPVTIPGTEVVAPPSLTPTLEVLPATSTPQPTKTPIPTDTPVPTETPLPTNPPTNTPVLIATDSSERQFTLVYTDTFSGGFWPTFDQNEQATFSFTMGGYLVKNLISHGIIFAVRRQLELEYSDLRIEVRASRVEGHIEGYYGVTCRFADGQNYYALMVGSDGWFGIGKMVRNVLTWLATGKDTAAVHTGNAPNLIRADCIGQKLMLWANSMKIVEVLDDTFSAGSFGVLVGTRDKPNYSALFDDYAVYVPVK